MSELLPCPFCGGEAHIKEVVSACEKLYTVGCSDSECIGYETWLLKPTVDEAVAAWNRRAERTCLAKPYEVDGETGFYDCIECECGEVNDVSARYCNGCGGLIEVVYE